MWVQIAVLEEPLQVFVIHLSVGGVCRQPSIVEISVFRAGQLVILSVPGEFTTMAGRRLRRAVYEQVWQHEHHPDVAESPPVQTWSMLLHGGCQEACRHLSPGPSTQALQGQHIYDVFAAPELS